MNKLQLYMTLSLGEYKPIVEINADDYVKSWVCDLRAVVCQVQYPAEEKNVFFMLKYIDTGMFVVVLRTVPDIVGNYFAAWIYVPYTLQIPGDDLLNTVNFVVGKMLGASLKQADIKEMEDFFAHEYADDALAPIFPASGDNDCAYRLYGSTSRTTIHELLTRFRFQTAYLPYSGVLLVDEGITRSVEGDNLTSAPLEAMGVLLPPADGLVDGYRPYIYGEDFSVPYYVPMQRCFEVVWRKPGAKEIVVPIETSQAEMRCPALELPKPEPPKTAPAPLPKRAWDLPDEEEAAPAPAPVEPAPAPAPVPEEPKPAPAKPATDLPERKKVYHFRIPAKSVELGSMIEFEITTSADIDGSPIDGYEATDTVREGAGRSNQLMYNDTTSRMGWLSKVLFAAAGFVLGMLVGYLCFSGGTPAEPQEEPIDPVQQQVAQEVLSGQSQQADDKGQASAPTQAQQAPELPEDVSLAAAIHYLDNNHTTWTKEEMEKYPDLRGLYDDMNNIRRDRLVNHWGPKLKDSRKFRSIVNHSTNKKTPKRNPYNSGDKTTIRLQDYLNTIDP